MLFSPHSRPTDDDECRFGPVQRSGGESNWIISLGSGHKERLSEFLNSMHDAWLSLNMFCNYYVFSAAQFGEVRATTINREGNEMNFFRAYIFHLCNFPFTFFSCCCSARSSRRRLLVIHHDSRQREWWNGEEFFSISTTSAFSCVQLYTLAWLHRIRWWSMRNLGSKQFSAHFITSRHVRSVFRKNCLLFCIHNTDIFTLKTNYDYYEDFRVNFSAPLGRFLRWTRTKEAH